MKLDAIVISVLYAHFWNMQKKGRQVVPWLQTTWALALSLVIIVSLVFIYFTEYTHAGKFKIDLDEPYFIFAFIASLMSLFFLIKWRYFKTSRHLSYMDQFSSLSEKKQKTYKMLVLGITYFLPIVLLYSLFK